MPAVPLQTLGRHGERLRESRCARLPGREPGTGEAGQVSARGLLRRLRREAVLRGPGSAAGAPFGPNWMEYLDQSPLIAGGCPNQGTPRIVVRNHLGVPRFMDNHLGPVGRTRTRRVIVIVRAGLEARRRYISRQRIRPFNGWGVVRPMVWAAESLSADAVRPSLPAPGRHAVMGDFEIEDLGAYCGRSQS